MLDYPKTLEEACKNRYRVWGGSPKGTPFDPTCCAYNVHDEGRSCLSHQCNRKPGKGAGGLYCGIHAKCVPAI